MLKNQVHSEGSSALMSDLHSALVTDLGICVLFAANTQHLSLNLASNKYFQYYIQSCLWAFFFLHFSSSVLNFLLLFFHWQVGSYNF